jgi:protocatechuate 3,4-dioxygenase beta subunit
MQIRFCVVTQEDGAPLADALVGCAVYGGDHPRGALRTARSDEQGGAAFEFHGTVERVCLFAAAAGRTPHQSELLPAAELPAVLQLPRGLNFAGTVRDAGGKPVAGAEIDLVIEGPDWIGSGPNLATGDGHMWPPQCRTDVDGRFALEWFDPRWSERDEARTALKVTHPDHEVQVVPIDRHLDASGVCEVDVALAAGLELTGQVRDAAGTPVADAEVEALGDVSGQPISVVEALGARSARPMSAVHRRNARTSGDGAFRLRGLKAGVYEVEVIARGAAPFRARVDPRTNAHLEVRLRRGASLEGTLVDAHGRPRAGELVQASKALQRLHRHTTTDDRGRFRIDGLPRRGRITLRAGTDVNRTIRLPSAPVALRPELLALEVRVVDRAGTPQPSAHVSFQCPWGGTRLPCDARGVARIEGPPGWYWVHTWIPGHAGRIRFFRMRSGVPRAVVLRLPKGRPLRGRVVDDGGSPVADCAIVATHGIRNQERHATSTDRDGAFSLSHLRGRYWILCQAPGHEPRAVLKSVGRLSPFAARVTVRLVRQPDR